MTNKKLFYKYQSLKDEYDKDGNCTNYTLKSLAQNQLYFNDSNNFNDPFDCRILVDNAGTREQWIDFLCESCHKCDREAVEEKVDSFTKGESGLVFPYNRLSNLKGTRICCFSESDDIILMWSHYADYHRGICLGFEASGENDYYSMPLYESNSDESPYSGEFRKVTYDPSNDLCVVKRFDNPHKNDRIVDERVFTKLHAWYYEHEYRITLPESHSHTIEILNYDKSRLKRVIFGLKVGNLDQIRVYNIINENYLKKGFKVEFFQAKQEIGKYEIKIEPIQLSIIAF
jgi:hypothetical protein